MGWKFYMETFGCKVNQYESQIIREAWEKLGGVETGNAEEADFICINSCAITGRAERDARNAVFRMKRKAPAARVILTGCAAQLFENFKPRKGAHWAEPDIRIDQAHKARLLDGFFLKRPPHDPGGYPAAIEGYQRARPVIKVQDGCSQNCAYCIVPQTRGKPVSREPQEILAECQAMLDAGRDELVISGINLRQYGKDKPEYGDFWDIISLLAEKIDTGRFPHARLRISSLEPGQLSQKGLSLLSSCKLICPHLHLSLQHASPRILKRMGRGHYDMDRILEALRYLRRERPLLGLGADILVGFPDETEDDLELLKTFISKAGLTYAHVFPYSRRPGTPAAEYPNQIALSEKRRRGMLIRDHVAEVGAKFLRECLSLPGVNVITDIAPRNRTKELWHGVNEFYTPCYFKSLPHMPTGMLRGKPVEIHKDGLLVEILQEDGEEAATRGRDRPGLSRP